MENQDLHVLLADDDIDDCDFFEEAVDEISAALRLTVLNDGVELMDFLLTKPINKPNLIFLDINMPRKSGIECMEEIKSIQDIKDIPIVIYSTSLDSTVVNHLYDMGASYYIQKPGEFGNIKKVIEKAIALFSKSNSQLRSREHFVIQP